MQSATSIPTTSQDWTVLRPLLLFVVIAYLIAWLPIPLLSWAAADAGLDSWIELSRLTESNSLANVDLAIPGWMLFAITRIQDFAFSLSGLLVLFSVQGWQGMRTLSARLLQWRMPVSCWLVVTLPLALYMLATVTSNSVNSFQFSFANLWRALFSLEAGLLVTLLLRGPMGEELGLRGFALPYLQTFTTPFKASLSIGIVWACWHIPVLLGRDLLSLLVFLLVALFLSFVFTWLFNNSGGSMVGVLLFHTFQNNEESFELFFTGLPDTDWETVSTLGLLLAGIGFALIVWRGGNESAVRLTKHVA